MLKVLIPVDGSPSSKYSIEHSMTESVLKDAEVHLITVISPSKWSPTRNPGLNKELKSEKTEGSEDAYDIPTLNPALNKELFKALGDADNKYADEVLADAKKVISPFVAPTSAVVRQGDAAEEIIRYAEEIGSSLIIMGNRGLGTFTKAFVGSVSEKVLTHACCSVLIVKEPNK